MIYPRFIPAIPQDVAKVAIPVFYGLVAGRRQWCCWQGASQFDCDAHGRVERRALRNRLQTKALFEIGVPNVC